MTTIKPRMSALPTLSTHMSSQRAHRPETLGIATSDQPPNLEESAIRQVPETIETLEATNAPASTESAREAGMNSRAASPPRRQRSTSAERQPSASAASDGATLKTTVSVPMSCLESLRGLARELAVPQSVALLVAAERAADLRGTTPKYSTPGGRFEVPKNPAGEPLAILTLRISTKNLAVIDELVETLGYPNRSKFIAAALGHLKTAPRGRSARPMTTA